LGKIVKVKVVFKKALELFRNVHVSHWNSL